MVTGSQKYPREVTEAALRLLSHRAWRCGPSPCLRQLPPLAVVSCSQFLSSGILEEAWDCGRAPSTQDSPFGVCWACGQQGRQLQAEGN